jgi:hypothetical protein
MRHTGGIPRIDLSDDVPFARFGQRTKVSVNAPRISPPPVERQRRGHEQQTGVELVRVEVHRRTGEPQTAIEADGELCSHPATEGIDE